MCVDFDLLQRRFFDYERQCAALELVKRFIEENFVSENHDGWNQFSNPEAEELFCILVDLENSDDRVVDEKTGEETPYWELDDDKLKKLAGG